MPQPKRRCAHPEMVSSLRTIQQCASARPSRTSKDPTYVLVVRQRLIWDWRANRVVADSFSFVQDAGLCNHGAHLDLASWVYSTLRQLIVGQRCPRRSTTPQDHQPGDGFSVLNPCEFPFRHVLALDTVEHVAVLRRHYNVGSQGVPFPGNAGNETPCMVAPSPLFGFS